MLTPIASARPGTYLVIMLRHIRTWTGWASANA